MLQTVQQLDKRVVRATYTHGIITLTAPSDHIAELWLQQYIERGAALEVSATNHNLMEDKP
jgi:hypothetical protein